MLVRYWKRSYSNDCYITVKKEEGIIPVNQAGFRKGRCTTDHLVKLILKKQFSGRKSTLATFFDVKKAYDSVWHARLLYKLKNIGITGMMFQYFKKTSYPKDVFVLE